MPYDLGKVEVLEGVSSLGFAQVELLLLRFVVV